MAYFETWIAILQIEYVVKKVRNQYDAAVLANHFGMALHMVAEHLMSRGYRLCWADKCQPARMVAPADKRILTRVHEGKPDLQVVLPLQKTANDLSTGRGHRVCHHPALSYG